MKKFTIANIAGGNEKEFNYHKTFIADAAYSHAENIGYGGPVFGGEMSQEAQEQYEEQWLSSN